MRNQLTKLIAVAWMCSLVLTAPASSLFVGTGSSSAYTNEEGALYWHITTNLVAKTSGIADPTNSWPYLVTNGTPPMYQYATSYGPGWSTSCWLAGVKGLSATCLGYVATNAGYEYPITMVSPQHFLCANHITWATFFTNLDAVVFMDTNDVVYYRYCVGWEYCGGDVAVGLLDSELPAEVGYLPIMPGNYTNWLPWGKTFEAVALNQDFMVFGVGAAFTQTGVGFGGGVFVAGGLPKAWTSCSLPLNPCFLRNNDSSSPVRALIGNQLVLLTAATTPSGGPNYVYYASAINSAMHDLSVAHSLGTDYQLTTIDLSQWNQ